MFSRLVTQLAVRSMRAAATRIAPLQRMQVRWYTKDDLEDLKRTYDVKKAVPINLFNNDGEQQHVVIGKHIDSIELSVIVNDLNMDVLLPVVLNPPSMGSLPAEREPGPLRVSELCLLSNADFKTLVPNIMMRNRLKEHLRILIGSPIMADEVPDAQVSQNASVSESAAAVETNSASIKPLIVPELLPGVAHAVVVEWKVKIGEHFERGQALCEIDMDLAVLDLEADEPGHISEIVVEIGVPFKAGDVLAIQTYHE